MVSVHPTLYILALEALALLGVITLVVIGSVVWRRQQRRKALVTLVARLKENGPQRLDALQAVVGGDAAHEKAEAVLRAETAFYQQLVQIFIDPGKEKILELDQHVEQLVNTLATHVDVSTAIRAASTEKEHATHQDDEIKKLLRELAQDNKQSIAVMRTVAQTISAALAGGVATVAVAPAASAAPEPALAPEPTPVETPSVAHNDSGLEELDIEITDDFGDVAPPPQAAGELDEELIDLAEQDEQAVDETTPAQPADANVTSDDSSAIDEMPDDLLFETDSATPAAAEESAVPGADVDDSQIADLGEENAGAEATQSAPPASEDDLDIDALLEDVADEKPAAAPPAASTDATEETERAAAPAAEEEIDADAFLDTLLGEAAGSAPTATSKKPAVPPAAAATTDSKAADTISEFAIDDSEPLIPDAELDEATPEAAAAENKPAKPAQHNAEPTVEDLAAELDELLS